MSDRACEARARCVLNQIVVLRVETAREIRPRTDTGNCIVSDNCILEASLTVIADAAARAAAGCLIAANRRIDQREWRIKRIIVDATTKTAAAGHSIACFVAGHGCI